MSPQTKKQSRRRGAHVRVQVFSIHQAFASILQQVTGQCKVKQKTMPLSSWPIFRKSMPLSSWPMQSHWVNCLFGQLPLRSTASSVNCLFGQPPPTFGIDSASAVNRLNTVQYTSPGDGSQYHLQLAQDPSGSFSKDSNSQYHHLE